MKARIVIAIALFALVASMGLSAQSFGSSASTGKLYSNDADNLVSTTGFTGLKQGLFFLNYGGVLTAGLGFKAEDLFVGVKYSGNIYAFQGGLGSKTYDDATTGSPIAWYNNGTGVTGASAKSATETDETVRVTTNTYTSATDPTVTQSSVVTTGKKYRNSNFTNNGDFLLGIGLLGIKTWVYQNDADLFGQLDPTASFAAGSNVSTVVTNVSTGIRQSENATVFKDSSLVNSQVSTGLELGYKIDLGNGASLKPKLVGAVKFVTVTADAQKDAYTRGVASTAGVSLGGYSDALTYTGNGLQIGNSATDIVLNPSLSLTIDAANAIGFGYTFETPLFSNKYKDVNGADATVAGTFDRTVTKNYVYTPGITTTTFSDRVVTNATVYTATANTFSSDYTNTSKLADGLTLKVKPAVAVGVYYDSKTKTTADLTTSSLTTAAVTNQVQQTVLSPNSNDSVVVNTVDLTPQVQVGLQYAIIPGVVTLDLASLVKVGKLYSLTNTTTNAGTLSTVTTPYTGGVAGTAVTSYPATNAANTGKNGVYNSAFSWDGASITPSADIMWTITPNAQLDLGLAFTGAAGSLDISQFNIQFILKL